MSRRQTLGALSPNVQQQHGNSSRQSLAPGKAGGGAGGGKDASRQSLKPPAAAGRPSMAPRQLERASNAGTVDARRSSAFGKPGAGGGKADPRPLNDKAFFGSCIRTIITYASGHGYPYALSPKVLTSPTGKDFTQLAFWLFSRFDPSLKAFGKVEDEVPLFFRRLNYPFQISKSALFAVGSPHSWPAVLAALAWLVELLTYDDRAEAAAGQGFDEAQRSERQFFAYASSCYAYFLAGDDGRAAAADGEMLGQFKERQAALAAGNAGLQQALEALSGEVEALTSAPSPLAAAQAARGEVLADQAKFREVIAGNQAQRSSLQKKLEERQADLEAKKAALAAVRADNEALAARVAGQALSKADVNRMVAERQKQKGLLDGVVAQHEALQQHLYQAEVQLESVLHGLEERLRSYHASCHRLALLPASAKRAGGTVYDIALNRGAATPGELISGDLKGVIRPGLLSLRERYRLRGRELAEDCLVLGEALDAAREGNGERAEELAGLRRQVAAAEERHRSLREALDVDIAAIGGQADKIKGEVTVLRDASLSRLLEAEEALRAATAEAEATSRRCSLEVEGLNHAVMAAAELLLQHAAGIRGGIQQLAAAVGGVAAEVQAAEALVAADGV